MKRILAAALLLISVTLASAQEGKNLYNKYSSEKGVSAVYISPAMLKLIGQLPDLKIQTQGDKSLDIGSLISSFQGFYMLEITEPSAMTTLRKDVASMIGTGRYELLMEMKEEGETLNIYTAGDEKVIDSFVFMATDTDGMQFICIDGAMYRSDVEKLIAAAAK
jgi:hypothetical protein